MQCIIPGTGIRAFGKCVYCLAKIGDEFYIEIANDSLALKTVNPARSGFVCFEFKKSFFNSFKTQNTVSCKMLSKSLISVFKGLPSLEKSVDYCTVDLNTKKDKMTFVFHCKYGIKKTHQLGFEDCEALRAVYNKDLAPNRVTQCSKPLQEALSSFPNSINEVTMCICSTHLKLSNYIDDQEDNYRVTRSKVNLYSNEFEDYHTDIDTSITFCLKELRAILTFTSSVTDPLTVQFETAGRPVIFSIENNPLYTADFVLATLSDTETNQSQSQLTQPTKKPSYSSNSIKGYRESSVSASDIGQKNGSRLSKNKKSSTINRSKQSPFPESVSGMAMDTQSVSESVSVTNRPTSSSRSSRIGTDIRTGSESPLKPNSVNNDLIYDDIIDDQILLETMIDFDDDDSNDFVTRKDKPHSYSTDPIISNDHSTQDSIIDTSSFLPSTPPPSKKFKSLFSVTDMFGGIQDSVTILAPDSEDEDT